MKKLIYFVCAFLGHESLNAQVDIDSLFYTGLDTTGYSGQILQEENAWKWTDTLMMGNYDAIDGNALYLPKKYKNIPDLAKDLTSPYITDLEKVRSIFMWMNKNIAYDYPALERNKTSKGRTLHFKPNTPKGVIEEKWEKEYYSYATYVLRKKRGICEGYATLFYELCKFAGVNCEMVCGYANKDVSKVNKYKNQKFIPTNHAWNKVSINDEWFYTDVTWASTGKYDGKRIPPTGYMMYYFLIPEEINFMDHVVNDKKTKKRNDLVGNY